MNANKINTRYSKHVYVSCGGKSIHSKAKCIRCGVIKEQVTENGKQMKVYFKNDQKFYNSPDCNNQ